MAAYTEDLQQRAFYGFKSSTDGSDMSDWLLADFEESDQESISDPELGPADYWKCVKCKNDQNNPMYRYCERCYQVGCSFYTFLF